jgi:membrane-bound metal-dependent hydrolase YbcI (DUF457 family)
MPLPVGHTAIGLAAAETVQAAPSTSSRLAQFIFICILANLPDIDTLFGLLIHGNGSIYHRGPTHSLLFALIAGLAASQMWRLWHRIPRFGFQLCALLIFSHVASDMLLTSAPVSLLWPMESNAISGHGGWGWFQVINTVVFKSVQDLGIVVAVIAYLLVLRTIRSVKYGRRLSAGAKRRTK